MINRIELTNFQSHKHTVIDFEKGINVLCGESDNGKTAIIRAIRWVCENRPLGTDSLNSNWNKKFQEKMSVKLWLDNGIWIERIRNKDRNGYSYFKDGNQVDLNAVGTDVPQIIKDLLKVSDVNFQFQLDPPYLLSMSSAEASRYLNQIIHLDSIDKMLSVADSHKRSLNSELKVVEKDISDFTIKVESLNWLDEANVIQKRIDKYDELLNKNESEQINIAKQIAAYEETEKLLVDFTEQEKLIGEIENTTLPDFSIIERQIQQYKKCEDEIVDFTEQEKLIKEIESVAIPDYSFLKSSINDFRSILHLMDECEDTIKHCSESLPDVCPYCGNLLNGDKCV